MPTEYRFGQLYRLNKSMIIESRHYDAGHTFQLEGVVYTGGKVLLRFAGLKELVKPDDVISESTPTVRQVMSHIKETGGIFKW